MGLVEHFFGFENPVVLFFNEIEHYSVLCIEILRKPVLLKGVWLNATKFCICVTEILICVTEL